MVSTKHKYIEKYPIKKTDRYLILGTIHPHNNAKLDFFYGNKMSLWSILSDVIGIKLNSAEDIVTILSKYNIAISDMILECDRNNDTITKDSELFNLQLNKAIKEHIIHSKIKTIFFTSGFSKNSAAKLFFDLFDLKKQIPNNWEETREFDIILENKKIKCVILPSPSGAANIGISKSKIYGLWKDKNEEFSEKPVKQFKIDFYKSKFSEVFNTSKM